jgi:3-deoxy-alpha-D-manno-octulosonate 8-oxidase
MKFRNFKMVGYVVYGCGAFNQLDEIIAPHRHDGRPIVFLVDHFCRCYLRAQDDLC